MQSLGLCQRPYHVEHTASRPISEVKQRWVWLVLGWVTAWEYQMLLAFCHLEYQVFNILVISYLCICLMYLHFLKLFVALRRAFVIGHIIMCVKTA